MMELSNGSGCIGRPLPVFAHRAHGGSVWLPLETFVVFQDNE